MMRRRQLAIGFMVAAMLFAGAAATSVANEGWQFEITPYLWYAGLSGDLSIHGQKAEFDRSASDLFDALDIGGSVRLGAMYDRFLIGAQVDYFSLSTDELDVEDRPQGGRFESDMLIVEAAMGYRVDGWAEGQSIDLMAGVRHLNMKNDLDVFGVGKVSREFDVTDAMVYVFPRFPVLPSRMEGLWFNLLLGIGAGDSDMAYEVFPELQYRFTESVAGQLGYRAIGWKHKATGENELNLNLAGLAAGITFAF